MHTGDCVSRIFRNKNVCTYINGLDCQILGRKREVGLSGKGGDKWVQNPSKVGIF